ncbi:MAG TPA: sigma-70 family RNA polymerase sigma factor [Ktedonobacterales bacterium]|nr:sigma-70 family RNA polymerase sigma factor [Ktedonobacterales bacterium]
MAADDTAMIEAWRRGDENGVRAVFEAHYPLAVRLAVLSGLSLDEAHDCAQEASARAFERRTQLRDPKAFPLWFHRIVTRQIMDTLSARRLTATTPLQEGDELAEDWLRNRPAQPDEITIEAERRAEVLRRLATLPPHYRVPLVLRYYANLSMREVAEATGMREGTVRVTIHRALAQLRLNVHGHTDDHPLPSTIEQPLSDQVIGVSRTGE